jgi:hypothetical protein
MRPSEKVCLVADGFAMVVGVERSSCVLKI